MSDLQVTLIILGIFIIAGVVVYNWMQERNLRKEVNSEFIVPQKDVLADDFHIDADAYILDKELAEVTEKSKHFKQHTIPAEAFDKVEETKSIAPVIAEAVSQAEEIQTSKPPESSKIPNPEVAIQKEVDIAPIVPAAMHEKIQALQVNLPNSTHSQIDLTAILYAAKPINSTDLSALIASLANIDLPITLYGLGDGDKWHVVDESSADTFKQMACSLQLADRGGPVAKNLLNKFQFAVEDAGLELNAHVEWQGNGDAMQRAIELDQFCIEVDQMVSVHIAQNDMPIHGTKFKGLAEASGMVLKEDGKFYFYANEAVLFTAIDTNNIPFTAESLRSNVLKSVTLQIEIPKVSNCEQVFNQMISVSQKMASSLNANLVDDNQKPLGDLQIEKIRQQLKVIHATMVARGIMPGSPSSMRLFN